ncbi:MAG: bile acid:sodium symporter family protein, partial [Bacteroidota bacterium]
MPDSILTTLILPASLFIIMMGMVLSLTVEDFKRVVRYPKAVGIGLTNQLLLLPIVGFVLCYVFQLSPMMAVGLMLLAACPGGTTSNLITYVSKGDIALSVTMTAIASTITIFSIPFIINWAMFHFLGQSQDIQLPVLQTMGQIFGITALPVSIGMLVRYYNSNFADRMERPVRIASTVIFVLILAGIVAGNWKLLVDGLAVLGPATFALNLLTMGMGWMIAKSANLNLEQRISIM